MTGDVNWGLVIAAGVLVGLLILVLIAGLYVLLSPPPVSEPLGTPDGMLAWSGPDTVLTLRPGPAPGTMDAGETGSIEHAGAA
ncbi:MAG TPA: hypothetical protein VLC52_08755 [Anaerolineae bacterium]|nr:hypothetical protein [Anaerolineae bacterium]